MHKYHFDSASDFLNAVSTRPIKPGRCAECMGSEQQQYNPSWSDTPDVKSSIAKAISGDYDTAQKIKPREVDLITHGALHTTVYDCSGDTVDVGRYLSGEPECMGSRLKKGKPIINIMVNITVAHTINRSVIQARGKAILEIMSELESNGYGVDITLVNRVRAGRAGEHQVTVKVKDSKEYFNLTSLAYWLVSPSVFRRLWFRFCEQESRDIQEGLTSSYGKVRDVPQGELDTMPDCVYFPFTQNNDTGQYQKAIQQIMETYKP